jgi:Fe-S cluster assembly protein SufD
MTTAPAKSFEKYAADYRAFTEGLDGGSPPWLTSLRQRGWEEFTRIGFPTARRGNEPWKYTDLRQLDRESFAFAAPGRITAQALQKAAPWSDGWHTAVIVDGQFSPELSENLTANGLSISGLIDAARSQPADVKPLLGSLAKIEGNAFVALNTAFLHSGVFVQVADGAAPVQPVHILCVTTDGKSGRAIYPRILLSAGENAQATVIETHLNLSDSPQFIAPVFEVSLSKNATIRHFRTQLENEETVHIATTRTHQPDNAIFNSTTFATGPALGRNAVHTMLAEPGAETTLHGLYITNHRSHPDNEISTTHEKPHGTSHQYYKGILAGKSRAVFSGKVWVQPGAMKTVAEQKDLNLLLSHGAEIDTMPSLEILADDVKCAHGATAGHVDRNMLFYLESRGVDRETAVSMLITAFAAEIIDEFEPEPLRQFLYRKLDEIIPQLDSEGIL